MDIQNIPLQTQPNEPIISKPHSLFSLPLLIDCIAIFILGLTGWFYFVLKQKTSSTDRIIYSPKKCTTDNDCLTNAFCDYSIPGGMGPNGIIKGKSHGSQECIVKCQNNSQCPSRQCQSYDIPWVI